VPPHCEMQRTATGYYDAFIASVGVGSRWMPGPIVVVSVMERMKTPFAPAGFALCDNIRDGAPIRMGEPLMRLP